ncbi:hypothetical protein APHAL10511_002183 [Amanita phalloides]|nr:hypothetical protein APHAL10511_002183 [Amanita phalloides]
MSSLPVIFPAEWGTPPERVESCGNGAFSTLYSDIGRAFYLRCGPVGGSDGWTASDSALTIWRLSDLENKLAGQEHGTEWAWLDGAAEEKLWEADARLMRDEIAERSEKHESTVLCTFLPNHGVAAYQNKRMEVFWEASASRVPKYWGIISLAPTAEYQLEQASVFATWTTNICPPGPRSLILTRLRVQGGDDLKAMIHQLMPYCRQHGLEKIEVWNLDKKLSDSACELGGVTFERLERLSLLKFYGRKAEEWEWVFNEKSVNTVIGKIRSLFTVPLDFAVAKLG